MSLENHILAFQADGGGTIISRTLAAWGVDQCVVTHRDGGHDEMTITMRRGIDASDLFPFEGFVNLFSPEGTRRFVGWMLTPDPSATGSSEQVTYRFKGPWWQLQRVTYKQLWTFYIDPSIWNSEKTAAFTGRVILNRKLVDGAGVNVSIRNQVKAVLDYARDAGLPIAYFTDALPALDVPLSEAVDKSCADVIRSQQRWCPSFVCYWNYNTIGSLAALTFTEVVAVKTYAIGDLTEFRPRKRYDLLAKGIRITYLTPLIVPQDSGDPDSVLRTQWGRVVDESLVSNGSNFVLETTVKLRQPHFDGSDLTDPEAVPQLGIAELLARACRTLTYEVSFAKKEQECDWSDTPGMKFNFTGGQGVYASANAVCRQITRDIVSGVTSYQCGPARHLGLDDLRSLVDPNRWRGISHSESSFTSGNGDQDTQGTGSGTSNHPLHTTNASTGATPQIKITFGTFAGVPATGMTVDGLTVTVGTGANRFLYAKLAIATGTVTSWITEERATAIAGSAEDTPGLSYKLLCTFTAAVTGGTATVTTADNLQGSEEFFQCDVTNLISLV